MCAGPPRSRVSALVGSTAVGTADSTRVRFRVTFEAGDPCGLVEPGPGQQMPSAACHLLHAICRMPSAACHLPHAICRMAAVVPSRRDPAEARLVARLILDTL